MVTQKAKDFVRRLGPGLITGAADDDPSGIATYSQAGSQFRFALVWTLLITTPLMIGIQMLSARIGWVTGEGLAANINKMFPRWLTKSLVGLLVVANTINIAADIGAMGEAVRLLIGGPLALYVLATGVLCIGTQVFFSYERTVRILKWLTLGLFAYVAVILTVFEGNAIQRVAALDGVISRPARLRRSFRGRSSAVNSRHRLLGNAAGQYKGGE